MIICKCLRCGWEWASRLLTRPGRCAKCYAKYWWEAKRIPAPPRQLGAVGRPHKYPVHLLNIGQHLTVEHTQNMNSVRQSVMTYGKRAGRIFRVERTLAGLRFTRTL